MIVKFPDEKDYLFITLGCYGVILTVYYYTTYLLERHAFFICKSHKVSENSLSKLVE